MRKIAFEDNKNIVHRSLRRLRREAGLSQYELSAHLQLLGVSIDQQMISRIENNARIVTDYELACLCRVLNVPPEALLFGGQDEK